MTKEQVEAHLARMAGFSENQEISRSIADSHEKGKPDPGPESRLQQKIIDHANGKGWPILWIRPLRQFKIYEVTPGWPDVSIALPGPRVLWLELKSARGAFRERQAAIGQQLRALGHEWHHVRSYKRYLEVINER